MVSYSAYDPVPRRPQALSQSRLWKTPNGRLLARCIAADKTAIFPAIHRLPVEVLLVIFQLCIDEALRHCRERMIPYYDISFVKGTHNDERWRILSPGLPEHLRETRKKWVYDTGNDFDMEESGGAEQVEEAEMLRDDRWLRYFSYTQAWDLACVCSRWSSVMRGHHLFWSQRFISFERDDIGLSPKTTFRWLNMANPHLITLHWFFRGDSDQTYAKFQPAFLLLTKSESFEYTSSFLQDHTTHRPGRKNWHPRLPKCRVLRSCPQWKHLRFIMRIRMVHWIYY